MINEAIILAGGMGTRLRTVVPYLPKCMASVAGKPFLYYVIDHLSKEGIQQFIFSLGYKSDIIIDYINAQFSPAKGGINSKFSIEKEPLGTGGAIKFACSFSTEKTALVVNGDTLFSVNVAKLSEAHAVFKADCTLSLKPMHNFERYGVVELNKDNTIGAFKEKQFYESGLINGGVYALNVGRFLKEDLPEVFSFEKSYLEKHFSERRMYGVVQDEYFIDIGIPADYERAQGEMRNK